MLAIQRLTDELVLDLDKVMTTVANVDTAKAKAFHDRDKDRIFEAHGVRVFCDPKSYLFINGSELDFEKTMVKTGFVFRNPLSNRSCSCGDSFTL